VLHVVRLVGGDWESIVPVSECRVDFGGGMRWVIL
jgi:hypothetical protein